MNKPIPADQKVVEVDFERNARIKEVLKEMGIKLEKRVGRPYVLPARETQQDRGAYRTMEERIRDLRNSQSAK